MCSIGVDLHSNSIIACYLTTSSQQSHRTFRLKDLADFHKTLRHTDRLAVEATGNTRWFVAQVKSHVTEVIVVNPIQFEIIGKRVKKTDRHDASALALFLSKELLQQARLKDERAAEIHSLAQTRDKLVKLRTTLINKLHALHRIRGINSRKSQFLSARGLEAVLARDWGDTT